MRKNPCMPFYDPHKDFDLAGEMHTMSRGRLVKARLPDRPAPNVGWYWFPLGNCHACQYYVRGIGTHCSNPKISDAEFFDVYMHTNICPEFEAGAPPEQQDGLDVMRAVGLVGGSPGQRVVVLHDAPWSIDLAMRAHREQSVFLHMAHHADRIADGSVTNDPSRGEYVDLSDDLERAAPAAP